MNINVTQAAVDCFTREWGIREGDRLRIFVRYAGGGEDAFAFGITRDVPRDPAIAATAGGISFFMEQQDVWYLEGRSLTIDCEAEEIVLKRTS
ncbi:HesB/YadR/YfhF family protein [Paenibacillus flagellatus]|uniref:Fe-S cluster assembly protein HesB n=1 Tax=Paenibacillus flagellatus TaxID=2211139 RepID=A0A2V5JZT2_9BACL|nr:Fe-S cluster assembly protein HesB [Paenibacillus flagellatus]PYI51822.1 Fe-S cluster assembly protein HesB [Paenibacillus flagellatus]